MNRSRFGDGRFDEATVLIDNPGSSTGLWPGSIGIGPDERLYIRLGASGALGDVLDEIQPKQPEGYALVVAGFDGAEPDGTFGRIVPSAARTAVYSTYSLAKLAVMGRTFFPYHPADIAVDAQGRIYVSVEEGRIFRYRPRPAAQN